MASKVLKPEGRALTFRAKAAWSVAWANAAKHFGGVGIRDGYTQLGELYRQAWLRDYRPYWLANNQAHYDRAAQLWVGRGENWDQVLQHWWDTHTLPPPAEVGLPAPSAQSSAIPTK